MYRIFLITALLCLISGCSSRSMPGDRGTLPQSVSTLSNQEQIHVQTQRAQMMNKQSDYWLSHGQGNPSWLKKPTVSTAEK